MNLLLIRAAAALALAAAPLAPLFAANAGTPPPWFRFGPTLALDGYVVVRAAPGVRFSAFVSDGNGHAQTGVPAVDALCQAFDVVSVEPLFAPGPHRDPAAFAAAGLDRDYFFVFAQRRSDAAAAAAAFAALSAVDHAQQDALAEATLDPDDPEYVNQWNLQAAELDCPSVWDHVTGVTTLVGIIDTGIDFAHPDITANLWTNPGEIAGNGLDDDGNGFVDDLHGYDFINNDGDPRDDHDHGTHVGGIVGATGNNTTNVSGVLWSVPLLAAKVLDRGGSGPWSTIAQGITYAADQGCGVTNMSIGGKNGDPTLQSAVQYAAALDVLQVAAAGNNGTNAKVYPAAYDEVLAIMATDAADKLAGFSSFGDWCDLCAPGDSILSLKRNGGTVVFSGTSMASPHAAAVGALMRDLNPQMDRIDLELALDYGARDLGLPGRDATYQWGILSALGSWKKAIALHESSDQVARGSSVNLAVAFPARPLDLYLVLPGRSGRTPGTKLGGFFAGDARTLPLNSDLLTRLSLQFPNVGVFVNFVGTLDGNGDATATFNIPRGSYFAGARVDLCALTVDPNDLSRVQEVGGSVGVAIQ